MGCFLNKRDPSCCFRENMNYDMLGEASWGLDWGLTSPTNYNACKVYQHSSLKSVSRVRSAADLDVRSKLDQFHMTWMLFFVAKQQCFLCACVLTENNPQFFSKKEVGLHKKKEKGKYFLMKGLFYKNLQYYRFLWFDLK